MRGFHGSPTGFAALPPSVFSTNCTLTADHLLHDSRPRIGRNSWVRSLLGLPHCTRAAQVFTDRTLTDRSLLCLLIARLLGFLAGARPFSRVVLTGDEFHTTSVAMMNESVVLDEVRAELRRRELPSGGWASLASSSQAALEATCFAALALGLQDTDAVERVEDFLLRVQNPNGSWPAFLEDDLDGNWVTSLAVIALRDFVPAIPARLKGFRWLMNSAGRESNWFWKWKFRTADRHVRFDPDKFGWPWIPNTASWVVPTAFAILALNRVPCTCGGLEGIPFRVDRGIEMLMDRACPRGGWNAGNGVVYGVPLAPHPDDTAIALLALGNRAQHPVVQASVDWLEQTAPTLTAPWSLAWIILALAAYGRAVGSLITSLTALPDVSGNADTCTLALVCLAGDCRRALAALGVNL